MKIDELEFLFSNQETDVGFATNQNYKKMALEHFYELVDIYQSDRPEPFPGNANSIFETCVQIMVMVPKFCLERVAVAFVKDCVHYDDKFYVELWFKNHQCERYYVPRWKPIVPLMST